ncbi:MAG: hypothetical protein ACW97W_17190 [Candidatus Hodarchaeales archaeon]|jgi:hypothetical protein
MTKKYRILLTKKSLNSIIGTRTPDRERVLSFLNFLMSGGWEENPSAFGSVNVWKSTDKQRILFSCEVLDGVLAVLEVLWTTNLAVLLKKSEYGEKEAPHQFSLHIFLYIFGNFPGQPGVLMHLLKEDFKSRPED